MKEFIYILFCLVILGLGILLLNSKGSDELFRSDYSVHLSPGVDFSRMNNAKTSYVPSRSQSAGAKSLIPGDASLHGADRSNYSFLPSSNYTNPLSGSTNTGLPAASAFSPSHGNAGFPVQGSPSGPSALLFRSGGSNSNAIAHNQGGVSQSLGTSLSESGGLRSSAPIDPFSDYIEGDITHPGGNPTGGPLGVPVGDGMLPFLLMGLVYTVFLIVKRIYRQQ